MIRLAPAFAVALLTLSPATAQRETAELAWKKHEVAVEYGPVPVGKHGLHELPVGRDWRMGFNFASQVRLSVPLVAGDVVAAPGSYRVKVYRQAEEELHFLVEGAGHAIGAKESNASFAGEMSEPKKPTKKLELEWRRGDSKADACETGLEIRFGEVTLDVPLVALDAKTEKGKAWTADVFEWPATSFAERFEKKLPTPVATVRPKRKPKKDEEPAAYNLVVDATTAKLIPLMSAPTSSFGFGAVEAPEADAIIAGSVEWSDLEQEDTVDVLDVESWSGDKQAIALEFTVGSRRGKVAIEMPQQK